jgi:hypothetical protein
MLARSSVSPIRALTAAIGACALSGALAGPSLAMPTENGPAPAPTSGPSVDLVRLHRSGTAAERARTNAASSAYTRRTDLRSPDSVDRARAATPLAQTRGGVVINRQPPTWPVHPTSLAPPSAAAPAGDGFNWGDAGIGAGGAAAILLAALGAVLLYRRRDGDLQSDLHGAPSAG